MSNGNQEFSEKTLQVTHVKALVERRRATLKELMPQTVEPNRMLRVFQNAITQNDKLLRCTDLSIITSLAKCGSFGLEPNTPLGQCHIIPYGGEATFQMGYQGLIELARRAGTTITCGTVHENDTVIAREGLHQDFDILYDIKKGRGEVIGVYAIAETRDGKKIWKYMSAEDCEAHGKKYSKAYGKKDKFGNFTSPWQTNPLSMWLKTIVIQVCKYAPKAILAEWVTVESREGINLDKVVDQNSTIDDDNTFDITASEPEPGDIPKSLDDVASEHTQEPPQDAQTQPGKPTRSELNKMLLQARKAAKLTQEQLEDMARNECGKAIGELSDEAITGLIDLCNAQQN